MEPLTIEEVIRLEQGAELVCVDSTAPSRDSAPTLVQEGVYVLKEVRPIIVLGREGSDLEHYASGLGGDRDYVAVPKNMFDKTLGELVNFAYLVVDGPTKDGGKTKGCNVYPYDMFSLVPPQK